MLTELKAMPLKAMDFLENTIPYSLPQHVPYIGMGSSYFAPLCFKYMGQPIYPELASEFFNYGYQGKKINNGVLLSQSGRSSEVLWCATLFEKFTAITNDPFSPLCKMPALSHMIDLMAGTEKYSSSKTYINTLVALFKGFKTDIFKTVSQLKEKEQQYDEQGKTMAEAIALLIENSHVNGLYVTGSGPNIGTALQAGLILSESTKLNFHGLPMAQFDHGPKETAANSVVINILAKGKSYERTKKLGQTIKAAGAHVFTVEAPEITENESVLHTIIPFNYLAYYLAQKLRVGETFVVGGKITEV